MTLICPTRRASEAIFAAVVVLCCAVGFGCSGNHSSPDPGMVNFLIESMPPNLDPRIATDAQSEHLDGLLFSSLLAQDAQMNPVPDLAERWETPDSLTYVFHLRRGVKFHDGRPLTSVDVKFTFDSILSDVFKSPKRGAFRMITSIDAPDDATVVFHLSEPSASFLWNLTRPGVGIVPRDSGNEISQHPMGSGPYRFVSMKTDEEIVLERNPGYFGGAPTIERVRFRIVPDAIVRALELRKGTADVALNSLSPDTIETLKSEPGISVIEAAGTPIAYISLNCDDPILAHKEVRQALAYATDRGTLIAYLYRGQARAASSLLPPNHWAFDARVRQYDYDPAHAQQLLDATGFKRGAGGARFHLTLKTSTEESSRLLSEALAEQWKRIGVVLDLRPLESATLYSDITRGSFQLYTFRWYGNNDPDMFDYVFSSRKFPPDGANRGHYKNPVLDALLDRSRVELNREKRKEILARIQEIVAQDEPYINLWYMDNVCVYRNRLSEITLTPSGDYDFLNLATLR